MAWNASIRSTSAPDLPELLPFVSGLYDVLVLEKTMSKSNPSEFQDSKAS